MNRVALVKCTIDDIALKDRTLRILYRRRINYEKTNRQLAFLSKKVQRMPVTVPRLVERVSMQSYMRMRSFTSFKKSDDFQKRFTWKTIGATHTLADDFQYACLRLDWIRLWCVVLAVYGGYAMIFATLTRRLILSGTEHFEGNVLQNMSILEQCFWLSMGHLISVGYGHLQPISRTAHIFVTTQFFVGILLSAVLLGVVVTKASLPSVKIIFSDKCLITSRNGVRHFMFRVANTRGNLLVSPDVRCSCFSHVETDEGESIWTAQEMEITAPPILAPTFNFVHKIKEDSPLWGLTDEQVVERNFSISLAATDNHTFQTLYATRFYAGDSEILLNVRFQDVLSREGNARVIDFRKFNEVVQYEPRPKTTDGFTKKSC